VWMIQVRHLPRRGVWLTLSLRPMPFVPAFFPVRGKSRNFQRVRNMKSPKILTWGKACDPGGSAGTSSGPMELDCQAGYEPYRETFPRVE
jgi:hypothetical protein